MTEHPTPGNGGLRSRWRHLRFAVDSPDLEIAAGVHAHLVMTSQVMITQVAMAPWSKQDDRSHTGETVIVVNDGALTLSIDGAESTVSAGEVAIIPASETYALAAGAAGCTRLDVLSPPDMRLAEEAFHQEHSAHGFE
jgi:quercetin dioxygenase-like cupin family protein